MKKFLPYILIALFLLIFLGELGFKSNKSQTGLTLRSLDTNIATTSIAYYNEVTESLGAREALAQLRALHGGDAVTESKCHEIAHEIGHTAYSLSGSFSESMESQDLICNGGYVHGVLESAFSYDDNTEELVQTACADVNGETYTGWQCHHGLGHGVMFAELHDLELSIAQCSALPLHRDVTSCTNGVYMQYFTLPLRNQSDTDILELCSEQRSLNQLDCFLYAPTLYLARHSDDFTGAEEWCNSASGKIGINMCQKGVIAEATKRNIGEVDQVRILCESSGLSDSDCMASIVSMYINHYGSLVEVGELCTRWKNQSCFDAIDKHRLSRFGF